jgi:hypothetical protein
VRVISSGRRERAARIEQPAEAVPTVRREAVSIGPRVEADPVIWIARLRTGHVVIFLASGSRASRVVASIAAAVEADSVVIASAAVDLVVIASVVAAAGLAGSAAVAAVDSEAGAEN